MTSLISDLRIILGADARLIPLLFFLFFVSAVLDFIGLSLIGPYVATIVAPGDAGALAFLGDFVGGETFNNNKFLIWFGVAIVTVVLVKTFVAVLVNYRIIRFSQDFQKRLRQRLFVYYQNQPLDSERRNSADLVYTIQVLTNDFTNLLKSLLQLCVEMTVAIAMMIVLIQTSPFAFGYMLLLLAVFVFSYDQKFKARLRQYGSDVNLSSAKMVKTLNEFVDGEREIRVLGLVEHFQEIFSECAEKIRSSLIGKEFLALVPRFLLEALALLFVIGIAMHALIVESANGSLVETVTVFGVAALRLLPTARNLTTSLNLVRYSKPALTRLRIDCEKSSELLHRQVPINSGVEHRHDARADFSGIDIKNVSFSFPGEPKPTLRDISLTISCGERVGIVGKTGSGKTTLMNIMAGLYTPTSGIVAVNGMDIRDIRQDWMAQVALIPQKVFLIDDSLLNNLTLGNPKMGEDLERLNAVLEMVDLKDFVDSLEQGLDTNVEERGERLSGGQRQRIAIARALLLGRKVFLLDEITSALDQQTEQHVAESLNSLGEDLTFVVISHRPAILENCDRILTLENGRLQG